MGHEVSILTLSRGARGGTEAARAGESELAARVLGATLYLDDLQDTSISESDPTISVISRVVESVRPTAIYTHSFHDVHQDHRNTYRAAMVAVRNIGRVYCFQSPSATVDFRPTRFVNIDAHACQWSRRGVTRNHSNRACGRNSGGTPCHIVMFPSGGCGSWGPAHGGRPRA